MHAWKLFARETGDPSGTHRARPEGSVGEGHRPYARHARLGEVGRLRSTWEAAEQGRASVACGGGGGKAVDQGEPDVGGRVPDSEPDQHIAPPSSCAGCGFALTPPSPEVGAVCGNSARTDLAGGRPQGRSLPRPSMSHAASSTTFSPMTAQTSTFARVTPGHQSRAKRSRPSGWKPSKGACQSRGSRSRRMPRVSPDSASWTTTRRCGYSPIARP